MLNSLGLIAAGIIVAAFSIGLGGYAAAQPTDPSLSSPVTPARP